MPQRLFAWVGLLSAGFLLLALGTLPAQDKPAKEDVTKIDYSGELPRIPPKSPADAMKTFSTVPGFHVEQAAAEPLVFSPVALDFDESGRMFVAEMIDYSEQDKEFLGTIQLLEDTDDDGRYDKTTVYADKLSWPTAVFYWDGGVFVGAAPDIWYLKDTDGDNKADVRQVVYTGFRRNNVQGLLNSFRWGLDNRIHGATSTVGGEITRPDAPDEPPVNLNGRDFAFDPLTMKLSPTSGGAQHGMSFDDWGRKYVSSNSDHIQMVMFEDRYVARNKFAAAPSPRLSIAADGPQAEVFRTSPVEPWRIVRTRLRASGSVPGLVEGGGRPAGYFTGATGVTIYRGNGWPNEMRGQAFVGDVGSNIVHRKVLEPNGVGFIAKRVDPGKEFLASTDIWFRPCQYFNAPDGNLYVCDVYREVIEHPASLPEPIKKHLDLTSGRDRGRIYRVVADGSKHAPNPKLGAANTETLVETLADTNGWHRDMAARLLYLRQDRNAIPFLESLAMRSPFPQGRLHGLYALAGLKALTADVVATLLSDGVPEVREHAVRMAELVADESSLVRDKVLALARDPALRVRYQVAFTLGEIKAPQRNATLALILKESAASDAANIASEKWMRTAVFSSLAEGAGEVLSILVADKDYRNAKVGREVLVQLASQIGLQAQQNDVALVLKALESMTDKEADVAGVLVRGLTEGLTKSNSPLRSQVAAGGKAAQVLTELLEKSRKVAADANAALPVRLEAIRTLSLGSFGSDRELLAGLLSSKQPQDLQLAAVNTLGKFTEADVAGVLLTGWPGFSPKVRAATTETIFSRPDWLVLFLQAVQKDEIPISDVEPSRVKLLTAHSDARVKELATAVAGKLQLGRRSDVLAAYKDALTLKGDAAKGKQVFQKICAACHRLEGVGHELAPSLATIKNRGAEAILLNVLDPNKEVNPQYVNYIVETTDGKTLTGIIAAETATSVTLKRAENMSDTVLRSFIEEFKSSGLSIMPEGLEKQIDVQSMADVIEYLMQAK